MQALLRRAELRRYARVLSMDTFARVAAVDHRALVDHAIRENTHAGRAGVATQAGQLARRVTMDTFSRRAEDRPPHFPLRRLDSPGVAAGVRPPCPFGPRAPARADPL